MRKTIGLLVTSLMAMFFFKGCTPAPDRKGLEKKSVEVVGQIINVEFGKQALSNQQLPCYKYDDGLLLFSGENAKAYQIDDKGKILDEPRNWEGHKQFFAANFFDAILLKYSLSKISFGDIVKSQKTYICIANVALMSEIWQADDQAGLPVFSVTPPNWRSWPQEEKNDYIYRCIEKLPSEVFNHNYMISFLESPQNPDKEFPDLLIPYWHKQESLITVTATLEWDTKNKTWQLSPENHYQLSVMNNVAQWPPYELDSEEMQKRVALKQLYFQYGRYWDKNGFDFLVNVAAGLTFFGNKWIPKEARDIILEIRVGLKKIKSSLDLSTRKLDKTVNNGFDLVLRDYAKLLSFTEVKESIPIIEQEIFTVLLEYIALCSQYSDASPIVEIESLLAESSHWLNLNVSYLGAECQKAKKQVAAQMWHNISSGFEDASSSYEVLERLIASFPECIALLNENDQHLTQTIIPKVRNWIHGYISSLIHEEDIARLDSLESISASQNLDEILSLDVHRLTQKGKEQVLENVPAMTQGFLNRLIQTRSINSEWAFSSICKIIQYCQARAAKKAIQHEQVSGMIKKNG